MSRLQKMAEETAKKSISKSLLRNKLKNALIGGALGSGIGIATKSPRAAMIGGALGAGYGYGATSLGQRLQRNHLRKVYDLSLKDAKRLATTKNVSEAKRILQPSEDKALQNFSIFDGLSKEQVEQIRDRKPEDVAVRDPKMSHGAMAARTVSRSLVGGGFVPPVALVLSPIVSGSNAELRNAQIGITMGEAGVFRKDAKKYLNRPSSEHPVARKIAERDARLGKKQAGAYLKRQQKEWKK